MRSVQDSNALFEIAGQDPQSWFHQARLLRASAQLIIEELNRIRNSRMTPADRSESLMTYMQSFMLLTSFCFENLIKGILISRFPNMVDKTKLSKDLWGGKNGHLIAEIIPGDIKLDDLERDLLLRLQTFAMWGGRYPIPMRANEFHNSETSNSLSLKGSDPAIIDNLFFRLSRLIPT